ncbi:hypothetical protein [Komagataeibacter rhaeticus]|nr:hypothetical protein [Komagataeibacter rhaeticus]KDU96685.1 hypothetical protein GLUCORHAEAF1_00335 [Komagataeibacter rhaeticus AF1]WPP21194.1 hypothetical protein SCD25_12300 [Komagataeibacter rhaeticus]GBQ13145.1 hypothetical protein AA16663_1392 [Komagataeibacter rhaeticus DSM 16663]SAY49775.1 hypothetical protein KRIGEM_02758 [Komagataeibacter rhaeticus]
MHRMPAVRRYGAHGLTWTAPFVILLLLGLPAHAGEREDQTRACKEDVFRLCFLDIPNERLMSACLESKRDRLSPRCRAMFEDDAPPPATPPARVGEQPAPSPPATMH